MTYTDGHQPPKPTPDERRFAQMTDSEREDYSLEWLLTHAKPRDVAEYARTLTQQES